NSSYILYRENEMEKSTRRQFVTLGAASTAALVASTSQQAAAQDTAPESTFDRIKRTGKMRLSIIASEPPFYIKDLAAGEWTGAGMQMANDMALVPDVDLQITEISSAIAVANLQSCNADLTFPLHPTPARALAVNFTTPIYEHSLAFVGSSRREI